MSIPNVKLMDPFGLKTLELFSNAEAFNKWLFNSVAPFCSGNILEIGSGIGNLSKFLIEKFEKVALSDMRNEYCEILNEKFATHQNFKIAYQIDLSLTDFENINSSLLNKFDTVIALNVIEHIGNDLLAIENCKKMLKDQGRLIILVPAYQSLFNSLDSMLYHYKRYTKKSLSLLLKNAGLNIVHSQYFNFAGILGWWYSGTVLKKKIITGHQLSLFNKLIPIFRFIDKLILYKWGLSVIVISEK
jgi:2-polyprenyl-3-methyl-5-hydroxy-6-metoxy-1,4-benzoquinol methylase